jgi:hypothetical protein
MPSAPPWQLVYIVVTTPLLTPFG